MGDELIEMLMSCSAAAFKTVDLSGLGSPTDSRVIHRMAAFTARRIACSAERCINRSKSVCLSVSVTLALLCV